MVDPTSRTVAAVTAARSRVLDRPEHVRRRGDVRPAGADVVARRSRLHLGDELADGTVERGREQLDLPGPGDEGEDAPHGREESHVGHAIGLVDDHLAHMIEDHVAAGDEVLEAAGAGHDELGPGAERLALRAVPDPAVDGDDGVLAGPDERPQLVSVGLRICRIFTTNFQILVWQIQAH